MFPNDMTLVGDFTFVESSLALVCSAMKFTQTQVRCIVTEQRLKMVMNNDRSQVSKSEN